MVALWWLVACATGPGPDSADKDTGPDDSGADSSDTAPDSGDTGETADTDTGETADTVDRDEDGYSPADGDCDDTRPHVYPGAPDGCDGLDQDCDGEAIPDHSCSDTWDVSTMWSWEIRWADTEVSTVHVGEVAGAAGPDLVLRGWGEDRVLLVLSLPESGLHSMTEVTGNTWTDDSPTWGIGVDLPPVDSTGDGLDDIWVTTTWRGGGPFGGLFLFPGTTDTIPADDVRLDLGAEAVWLDGGGVQLVTESDHRGGVGDLTGDGLADVLLFTIGSGGESQISALAGDPDLTGSHTFAELPSLLVGGAANVVSANFVGDLDGDGFEDVRFRNPDGIESNCVLSGGEWREAERVADWCPPLVLTDATSGQDVLGSYSRTEVTGGDVDGDGLADLMVDGRYSDGLSFVAVLSGGLPSGEVEGWIKALVTGPQGYGWVPDIDGDGVNDPVTTSGAASSIALRGGGTFEEADLRLVKPWGYEEGYTLNHVADIDQDGWPEWFMSDINSDEDQLLILRGFDIPWDDPAKW